MKFDISRLRRADRIIGVGAIALFVFLFFFKWYGYSSNAPSINGVNLSSSYSINGWHAFTVNRWIWLITIVVALGAVAISMGLLELRTPVQPGVLVAGLGALSTLAILYRIIHHPTASASFGSFHASVGIKIGIWLGLIAAAAVTYGGYLGMQAEGTSLADVRAQATDAVGNLSAAVSTSQPTTAPAPAASAASSSEAAAPPLPPPAAAPSSEPPVQPPPTA
jgi:hypothetical protein